MLTQSEIDSYYEEGYLIRRNALSQKDIQTYRSAIDRILNKCLNEGVHDGHLRYIDGDRDDIWGINNIFHPSIREEALVESLANPQILEVMEALLGDQLMYHLCTLLVSSAEKPYHINWHRDSSQAGEVPLEDLLNWLSTHVQLNGALYDDDSLYIVPGSHRREMTDAERAVIQQTPKGEMPNQLAVRLNAGDIVFYNSSKLHKGYNHTGAKRQTLHYAVLASPPKDDAKFPYQPISQDWLNDSNFLDSLPERLIPLFDNWLKYV